MSVAGRGLRKSWTVGLVAVVTLALLVTTGDPASAVSFVAASVSSEAVPDPLPLDESPETDTPPTDGAEETEYGDFSNPPSGEAPAPVPEPAPEPDPEAAVGDLDDFDKSEAKILERGEYEQTYQGPGDSKVTELSDVPLNVKVDGEWKPVLTKVEGRGPFAFLGLGGGRSSSTRWHHSSPSTRTSRRSCR